MWQNTLCFCTWTPLLFSTNRFLKSNFVAFSKWPWTAGKYSPNLRPPPLIFSHRYCCYPIHRMHTCTNCSYLTQNQVRGSFCTRCRCSLKLMAENRYRKWWCSLGPAIRTVLCLQMGREGLVWDTLSCLFLPAVCVPAWWDIRIAHKVIEANGVTQKQSWDTGSVGDEEAK